MFYYGIKRKLYTWVIDYDRLGNTTKKMDGVDSTWFPDDRD